MLRCVRETAEREIPSFAVNVSMSGFSFAVIVSRKCFECEHDQFQTSRYTYSLAFRSLRSLCLEMRGLRGY